MKIKKAKKATVEIDAIARKTQQLFLNEEAEAALTLLDSALVKYDHVRLWRLKARILVFFEREAEATDILRRVVPASWYPGFWELVQSGLGLSNVIVSDTHKLAYFPVPKCGSTSIHNVFGAFSARLPQGEDVRNETFPYQLINRLGQDGLPVDFKKILLVRPPLERIRSYYDGNIMKRGHLVRDTGGKNAHYGLKTKPDYGEFIDNFHAYRRTFLSVRNHTDPLVGFAGNDPSLFDWIGEVRETGDLISYLSDVTGMTLPNLHDMRSTESSQFTAPSNAERALLAFYADDIEAYERWF